MLKKVLFALLALITTTLVAQQHYSLNDFFKSFPDEVEKSKSFEQLVQNNAPTKLTPIKKAIKIAVIYPGNQVSDYWRRSVISFEKRLALLGIQYSIENHFTNPGTEIKKQEKQILQSLRNEPDYLIFTLDVKKHKRIIERILAKGKTKVILQNITTPLKQWKSKKPFLYVGFDHELGSRILADWYISKTGGIGQYAVIYYTKGLVSEMRGKSFINYIKKETNLQLTKAFYTDGSKADGKRAAEEILKKNPNIKFIYACGTDVALGAYEVLKKAKKDKEILINGWGGGSAELDSITRKQLNVTAMRVNDDNGIAMAEAIGLDLHGKEKMVPQVYSGRFELVSHATSADKLEKLKAKAFRYSKQSK